ncbi:MAG: helix-turn-helix domain-containing protein [Clostridiales bacterium]|nr:helix-turn-helix domain-containing protein [Clostridiales bacterium]
MSYLTVRRKLDITPANLSILKNNKAKAVRFSTLDAICRILECQPGDILEYVEEEK